MWRSPYFSPITSPAGAAANDSSRAPQANQQQFPPGVQQHIQQATPMQCPVARLGGVPAFQPLGSPSALHRTLNPVSQMPLGAPQMIPPGNPFISRSPMQQPASRGLPSPVAQSSPFNSPLRQVRNSPPSLASPGLTAQQPFRPPTVPPPRGAVSPLQRPNNSSTIPYPGGILSPPQRSLLPSTVPSPGGVIIPPQRLHATATMVPPGGVLTSPQKSFISSTVPPSGGIVMPQQRPLTSLTVPSPGGVLSSPQRPFVSSPGGVPPPPQRPSTSLTVPSPRGIISSPQRPSRPPTLLPSGSFPIPPQQPFVSPTVPSPRRVLSPQQQPFVPASLPSPRGIASPSPPSSPFNRPPHGGFLSPPQQPLVPSALPSPRGLTSQVQVTSSFNSPSWQGQNPYPSYPNMNLQPTVVPSVCPMQHVSPFNSPQQPLRSPQPSAFGLNRGPSIAAALDRRIMEKRLRSAAAGGLPTSMSRQGTNVRPPPVPSSPIGQPAQWRTSSPSKPHASIAFYKDGGRGRENRSRRNYSPGSFGSKPRVSRCFSPPPPDIARVVNCVMSEEYYVKKDDNQVDSCGIKGTEKLTELHNRFEKEILNMASLEQGDNDDEGISSDRSHHTDQDNSDVESLVESDVNDNSVKSRLRLFPSDDEENSDEDSSEVESHALSDSTSGSDNDDEDSNAGGGLSDDDDDDDDDDEHVHKGPSVAEIRKRKIEDPRRLHPELWFNEAGETNDGPVCRCSSSDKGKGIRHGIYPGETAITACDSLTNNPEKLHHYWVTVTPHTNFMTSNPSIVHADGKDYTFEGFSMFCHHPLDQVPLCSVIRFNIEYTIHVVSQPVPENFCVKDLDLFSEFLFFKVLELEDWNFNGNIQDSCQRYHFMPRFVHRLTDSDGSKACHELLPMSQVLSHVLNSAEPLVTLSQFDLSKEKWEEYSKLFMNAIVMNPDKKPAALRVDDLQFYKDTEEKSKGKVYPYIVHHSIRPVQMSFAGDPKYQRLMKTHNKMRNLISNTPVPTRKNQDKLVKLKIELEKMRVTSSMRRDVVVEVSSRGMIKTGLKSDICQHALLLPVLVHHVRYHMCLRTLDEKMGYVFKDRALLQLALTHPSYHLNFGMNPDHARNSLSNCGVKQPRYGDRKVRHLHTRKKGITQLIRVMSNLGKMEEHQSMIRHNERLEFLGDAVLELISSAHLYFMLPYKPEGGLAMYRSALVQNRHLAQLAKKLGLSDYMQYSHGPDLCLEEDLNHAMANCFEALLGALYLEDGLKTVTELFTKLAFDEEELREVWTNLPKHPLQAQQPDGDRHLIASSELLQKLEEFEKASGIEFTHIRLLARAFTHAQVGFNNLTLGSNQRMEFLGDSVLQFVVSVYLFKHFPEHHEGHLTLLRSSLVNHRIQAKLARELGLDKLINFGSQTGMKAFREKLLADILEAFVAALYVDKGLRHVEVFCRVCLFPRLEEFIINQDWMDAKSQLQQCCLTSRVQGKTPDLPQYKVLQNKGPAHHKHYTVAVYYKNRRLGSGEGKSIQQAEMAAAKDALASHYFPELARQKRLLDRKHQGRRRNYWNKVPRREKEKEDQEDEEFKPQWEEMETFEAEENNHSRAFWEEDDNCQERENWEMEEGSSDARENWEVEVEDWEKEYGDSEERENWGVKSSGVEEKREEEEDEKIDSKENWEDEDENGEERENWEVELSDARENWKEGTNNEAREKWNVENNNAKEIWDEENSDTKEIQEEEKKSKNTGENENLEDENIESKENWEDEKNEPKEN